MTEPAARTHTHEDDPGAARLLVLSDGIYAIAMTLLVINVAIPANLGDSAFHKALSDALPKLGAFALSFALTAGFWRDHRRILTELPTETVAVTRLVLLGLGLVALLPFPTTLLAQYASHPEAVASYAGTMAAINAVHTTLLLVTQRQMNPSPASPVAAVRRRLTAQLGSNVVIFGLSIPLAFVNTDAAMWFWLTLIPAHYILAHHVRRPSRQ